MATNHYHTLGLNEQAGGAKIKRHYYELCKKYHPDVATGDATKMIAINEAYRVLSDPVLRSQYDRDLAAKRRDAAMAESAKQARRQTAYTAPQPAERTAPHAESFRRNVEPRKKSKAALWFMAAGASFAALVIAVSYLAPFPGATAQTGATTPSNTVSETNTNTTPSSTTADTSTTPPTTDQSTTSQATVPATDTNTPPPAADTTATPAPTDSTSTTTNQVTTDQSSTTRHHHKSWYDYFFSNQATN